jgi:hypothetical protein
MNSTPRHIHRHAVALALTSSLLVAGAASADPSAQDLRSPDTRDAAGRIAGDPPFQDLRSPDTRETDQERAAVERYKGSPAYQQALEAARLAALPQPAPVAVSDGVDWDDVGIGAGGVLAIVALAGTTAILRLRRRGSRTASIA